MYNAEQPLGSGSYPFLNPEVQKASETLLLSAHPKRSRSQDGTGDLHAFWQPVPLLERTSERLHAWLSLPWYTAPG